jgi:hypothetical protein
MIHSRSGTWQATQVSAISGITTFAERLVIGKSNCFPILDFIASYSFLQFSKA